MSTSGNSRLAKNTLLLYLRTFVGMVVGLYTSRIVLKALGIEDFGVYNIVGGFVGFFTIISGTLVATTQRFINFETGKKGGNVNRIFGASMGIHILLSIFLLVLFETVGLWFLNAKLNIPVDRMVASNWVYQISVLSFLVSIISTPYTAMIVANERMDVFAYINLLDVFLKLLIAFVISYVSFDKLIIYGWLLLFVALLDMVLYLSYCRRHFPDSKFNIVKNKDVYRGMIGFASMNFIGAFAGNLAYQGMNIILNLFFGVTINAAKGISGSVLGAMNKFSGDFMTALNPQITKEYASGDKNKSRELCLRGSKFSFFLLLIFAVPVFYCTPYILKLWLGVYPDYSVAFIRCALVLSLMTMMSNALITEILATGNLKSTTFWIGGVRLLILPIMYIVFKLGYPPEYGYYVFIIMELVSLSIRLLILENISGIKFVIPFIKTVIFRVVIVVVLAVVTTFFVYNWIYEDNFISFLLFLIYSMFATLASITLVGLTSVERNMVITLINKLLNKVNK